MLETWFVLVLGGQRVWVNYKSENQMAHNINVIQSFVVFQFTVLALPLVSA